MMIRNQKEKEERRMNINELSFLLLDLSEIDVAPK
jgi:hypothetical protein